MSRRAKRPLNPNATQAADNEIYARHESDPRPNPLYDAEGNRRPLSATDPAQADLRREWMDLYIANGGEIENPSPDPAPPDDPIPWCPDEPPDPDPTPPGPPVDPAPVTPPTHDPAETANLHVRLLHRCDQSPLANGSVRISGPEMRESDTDADGWAMFDGITPGLYQVEGIHPQHHPGTTSADAPASTTTAVDLTLQAEIQITPENPSYTVVLDKNGNAPAAHKILKFTISNGPPNHLIDVQVSRDGAASLTGGPGLGGSWVQADGRNARKDRKKFSSWSNGQTTLQTDGSGAATFQMPLEWWRDQVRRSRSSFTTFTYHFRVIAFRTGTPVCTFSSADASASGSVVLRNNLTAFRVVDLGYINGGQKKSIRMEFEVREANTTEMYTFVQWKRGGRENYSAASPAVMTRPTVRDYNIRHRSTYPVWQLDRVGTDPRYWDGTYTITAGGKKAAATDKPSSSTPVAGGSTFTHIDFDTRVHLNFEVPAAVTVSRQDGSAPIYGVVVGVMADPQPIKLDSDTWNSRILRVAAADGTETLTHPNTYAGPGP